MSTHTHFIADHVTLTASVMRAATRGNQVFALDTRFHSGGQRYKQLLQGAWKQTPHFALRQNKSETVMSSGAMERQTDVVECRVQGTVFEHGKSRRDSRCWFLGLRKYARYYPLMERQPLHPMDDPSRHSKLALRNLLCN